MQLVCGYFQLDVAGVLRRRARRLDFVGNAIYYRREGRDRAFGLKGYQTLDLVARETLLYRSALSDAAANEQ